MPGYKQFRGNGRGKRRRNGKGNGRFRRRPTWNIPMELKPELKFVDLILPNTALTTAWVPYHPTVEKCLNGVGQGDDPTDRDGRAYFMQSVMVKGIVFLDIEETAVNPPSDIVVRVLMVHDTQTNGAELTPTDVMNATGLPFLEFRNLDFTTRFKVLKDKTFVFRRNIVNEGVTNSFASNKTVLNFNWYHTFPKPIKVVCKDGGETISSITNDSIQIIAVTSIARANMNYTSRVRFRG